MNLVVVVVVVGARGWFGRIRVLIAFGDLGVALLGALTLGVCSIA